MRRSVRLGSVWAALARIQRAPRLHPRRPVLRLALRVPGTSERCGKCGRHGRRSWCFRCEWRECCQRRAGGCGWGGKLGVNGHVGRSGPSADNRNDRATRTAARHVTCGTLRESGGMTDAESGADRGGWSGSDRGLRRERCCQGTRPWLKGRTRFRSRTGRGAGVAPAARVTKTISACGLDAPERPLVPMRRRDRSSPGSARGRVRDHATLYAAAVSAPAVQSH